MEQFPLFVNIIAAVAIISGLLLGVWWVIALYWMHSREKEQKLVHLDLPSGIKEVTTGIPMALIIFFISLGAVMVGYVLYIWLGGITY